MPRSTYSYGTRTSAGLPFPASASFDVAGRTCSLGLTGGATVELELTVGVDTKNFEVGHWDPVYAYTWDGQDGHGTWDDPSVPPGYLRPGDGTPGELRSDWTSTWWHHSSWKRASWHVDSRVVVPCSVPDVSARVVVRVGDVTLDVDALAARLLGDPSVTADLLTSRLRSCHLTSQVLGNVAGVVTGAVTALAPRKEDWPFWSLSDFPDLETYRRWLGSNFDTAMETARGDALAQLSGSFPDVLAALTDALKRIADRMVQQVDPALFQPALLFRLALAAIDPNPSSGVKAAFEAAMGALRDALDSARRARDTAGWRRLVDLVGWALEHAIDVPLLGPGIALAGLGGVVAVAFPGWALLREDVQGLIDRVFAALRARGRDPGLMARDLFDKLLAVPAIGTALAAVH